MLAWEGRTIGDGMGRVRTIGEVLERGATLGQGALPEESRRGREIG